MQHNQSRRSALFPEVRSTNPRREWRVLWARKTWTSRDSKDHSQKCLIKGISADCPPRQTNSLIVHYYAIIEAHCTTTQPQSLWRSNTLERSFAKWGFCRFSLQRKMKPSSLVSDTCWQLLEGEESAIKIYLRFCSSSAESTQQALTFWRRLRKAMLHLPFLTNHKIHQKNHWW